MTALVGYVRGLGFWAPGYPSPDAWHSRSPKEETAPPCKSVGSRLKRGTSLLTRMSVECMEQAGTTAGFDMSVVPTVFGSAYGEMQIAIEQMKMMREDEGIVSPARFKNSVHNTAAGILSIAQKNKGFTTAVAAGAHTLGHTMLEALVLLHTHETVLLSVADEALPEPLHTSLPYGAFAPLGIAFALSVAEGPAPLAKLSNLRRVGPDGCQLFDVPEAFANNPSAPGLGLLEAIHRKEAGAFALTHGAPSATGYAIDLDF